MDPLVYLCGSIAALVFSLNAPASGDAVKANIVDTRCEMQSNPLGIDTPAPRLSWLFKSDLRATKQVAYQVRVVTRADQLTSGNADLWDSGRVDSDQSLLIPYAGKALSSDQTAYWSVKLWTNHGEETDWSSPARWTMGLLDASDWKGQWIGADVDLEPLHWRDAKWICYPTPDPTRQAVTSWVFRRTFELPAGIVLSRATLTLRADDRARVELNGKHFADDAHWASSTARPR